MVLGFGFRSPEVVKFLCPAHKYAVCVVPEQTTQAKQVIQAFLKQPVGQRKRVYMHKSLSGMVQCFKQSLLNSTQNIHIVFDAYSILSKKKCVKILDLDSRNELTWQLKKTLPSTLETILSGLREGVAEEDLACLSEHVTYPEDLIQTDKKVNDDQKQAKVKSFLHVLQDIQAKNASKRDIISFWLCAFYVGALTDKQHKLKQVKCCGRWSAKAEVNVRMYKEKVDKTARQRMMDQVTNELKKDGFELKKAQQAKIFDLLTGPEHVSVMRAMFLMETKNMTSEQAAYMTGANISCLALINRSLYAQDSINSPGFKHKSRITQPSMPRKMLKKLIGPQIQETGTETSKNSVNKQSNTSEPTDSVVGAVPVVKRKVAPVFTVKHGLLTVVELLQSIGVMIDKKHLPTTAKYDAPKYIVHGNIKYKVSKGQRTTLKYAGKRYKIKGV